MSTNARHISNGTVTNVQSCYQVPLCHLLRTVEIACASILVIEELVIYTNVFMRTSHLCTVNKGWRELSQLTDEEVSVLSVLQTQEATILRTNSLIPVRMAQFA